MIPIHLNRAAFQNEGADIGLFSIISYYNIGHFFSFLATKIKRYFTHVFSSPITSSTNCCWWMFWLIDFSSFSWPFTMTLVFISLVSGFNSILCWGVKISRIWNVNVELMDNQGRQNVDADVLSRKSFDLIEIF